MQEALYVANSIPSRDGIQKSVVFISDGLPVGHNQEADYSEEDIIVEHIDDNNHKLSLEEGALPSEYQYDEVSTNGTVTVTATCPVCNKEVTGEVYSFVSDAEAAYQEADKIKAEGVNIYTVGISLGYLGETVLKNIQNVGYVNAKTIDDLKPILNNIAAQIAGAAGTNGQVLDTLTDSFEYIDGTAKVSVGEVTYDNTTKTFTWNIGTLKEAETIVFEYNVKIKNGLKESAGKYLVSEKNVLNFYSYEGKDVTLEFPVIEVKVSETVEIKPSTEDKKIVEDKNPKTGSNKTDINIIVLSTSVLLLIVLVAYKSKSKLRAN